MVGRHLGRGSTPGVRCETAPVAVRLKGAGSRPRGRPVLSLSAALLVVGLTLSLVDVQAADPPPLRQISDPNPNFSGIWVDTINNELFVSDDSHHSVLVYARTASGITAPLRQIQGTSTQLDFPASVVVDVANGEVWSAMNDTSERAVVHTRTANGDAAPLRVIDYRALRVPSERSWGWAVDPVNDEVAGAFQRNPASVNVFDRVTGDLVRTIMGANTRLNDAHGISIDSVHDEIFVTNEGHVLSGPPAAPSITVYARTASGDVAPLRTVEGPSTGLSVPKHISLDMTHDEMAVANGGNDSITVYARIADGEAAPLRTIAGPLTGLANPTGVFIDATNEEILVTNWGNHMITVYARTAEGDAAPLRTIMSGPQAAQVGIGNPGAVALDLTNDEIAVTNCVSHPRVAIFDRLANGQVAPKRVLSGPNTRISRSTHGVWIDPVNDEIVVPSGNENAILVFDRVASGDSPPKRVIQGPSTKIRTASRGIMVDSLHDEIVMSNGADPATGLQMVSTWDRLADGDVPPKRTFTSEQLTSSPVGVWVDGVHNEIVVGVGGATPKVLAFDRLATGLVVPKRTITGPNTMLDHPSQLAVDATNDEIVVTNLGNRAVDPPVQGSITVYNRTDDGDVAPKRFIQGPNSGVGFPRAVWVDPLHNEIGEGDSKFNWIQVFPRLFEARAVGH